jgi:hypothetical protein
MKNFIKLISIVSLLALVSCEQSIQKKESVIKAVPKNAMFIVEANDMGDAFNHLQESSLWNIIEEEKNISIVSSQLNTFNLFLLKNKISIIDNKIMLSVHNTGVKSFDYLVFLEKNVVDSKNIKRLRKYRVSTKTYDKAQINKYNIPKVSTPIYISSYKGVFILSRNIILVENSIRQLNSGRSLMDDEKFNFMYKSIDSKEDFNVLINVSELKTLAVWTHMKSLISWTNSFSDWIEFDISPEEDEIFLSGITSVNDSIGNFVGIFKNQKAQEITIDELLPSGTSFSIALGYENFPKYYRSYTNYLRKQGKNRKLETDVRLAKIKRTDLLDSWMGEQIIFASIYSNKNTVNFSDLVLIQSKEEALALDALKLVSDKSVIDFRSYAIRKFDKSGVLKNYLGENFRAIIKPYYTVVNDVVVFSDNLKIVKNVISDYLDGRSLSNYQHFRKLKDDLSSKSNILFYFKNPDFAESLSLIFPELKKVIHNNLKDISKFKSGALQISYEEGIAFTNMLLKQAEEEENEVKPIWDLDFDTELYPTIHTLYNHKTNNKEVAVQDKNNVLYLVSTAGKILWKQQLDAKILGEIKQIDLYKNKKYQMVFNTENKLYLIDRNGKKLPNYPIKLKHKATAGVGVFDYAKNRDYRLLVPMGKRLKMYDGRGHYVEGFAPNKLSGVINKTPQHFRVKGKDFIIASTSNGHIYVLDRRGNKKFNISKTYPLGRNNFYLNEGSTLAKSSFVTTTKNGELLNIFIIGSVDVTKIDSFDENTFYRKFGDETISLSSKELKWSNKNSAGIYDVDGNDFSEPQLFKKENSSYVMFGSKTLNKIFLFNENMDLQKGFPIYGQIVGKPEDYNRNGVVDFPVMINQEKGNLKMYSVN